MLNTMQSNTYGIRTELIPLIETFDYLSGRANGERIYINEQEACERHPYLRKKIKEILRKGIEFEKELDEAVHVGSFDSLQHCQNAHNAVYLHGRSSIGQVLF